MQPVSSSSFSVQAIIDDAEEAWLQEANLEINSERRSLKKQAVSLKARELEREARSLVAQGMSGEEVASHIDLLIKTCQISEQTFEQTWLFSLQRRANEREGRTSLSDEFRKSADSFALYLEERDSSVNPIQKIRQSAVLSAMTTVHIAGQAGYLTGKTIAAGVRGICNMTPRTHTLCKKTGSFARRAIVATLEATGAKEFVKETLDKLNAFDGSSAANILVDIYGFPTSQAAKLGRQWVSDVKSITLGAGIGRVSFLAYKGIRHLAKGNNSLGPKKFEEDFPFTASLKKFNELSLSNSIDRERALQSFSWPAIASLPSDAPKHFTEFSQRALPYICEGNGVRAYIPTVTVGSKKDLCSLYLIANTRRPGLDAAKFPVNIVELSFPNKGLRKIHTLLDMIFYRSRMENHSSALLLLHETKGMATPIMQALEGRVEKIIGKSSFPKQKGSPMILLEIALKPKS